MGQNLRLSRACSGYHHKRPADMCNRVALSPVQALKD